MPTTKQLVCYLPDSPINGLSAGSTKIANAIGTDFTPIEVSVEVVTANPLLGVLTGCLFSIGTNSPDYNNILPAMLLPLYENKALTIPLVAARVYNNEEVYCKVSSVGVGDELTFRPALVSMRS